jgi:Tfp pilus assembly protein PilX
MMTVLWIAVAVVVVLILVAVIMAAMRKSRERRLESDRQRAYEHKQQALHSAAEAEKQQATADEVGARSRKAQAESDEKAAEARRLSAGADERRAAAEQARQKMGQHARRVDALDPDYDPKAAEQTEKNGAHPADPTPRGAHRAPQAPDHTPGDDQQNGQLK